MNTTLPTPETSISQRLGQKIGHYGELVKFEHTIFALPFALSALILATGSPAVAGHWPDGWTILWVLLAMVGGRTYAMGLNRLADATIDAENPRTRNRPLQAGTVSKTEGILITAMALGLLVFATFQLPVLCQMLLPVAIGILTLYSYMKRFSSLCHVVLGLALGSSAIGGWLALSGQWDDGLPVLFGFAVACWVAGFDIIYACQDVAFDEKQGLHSIPVRLGVTQSLLLSRWFHGLCLVSLMGFGIWYSVALSPIGWGYGLAVALIAVMLVWEHRLVRADDLSRVNMAFFVMNSRISTTMLVLVLAEHGLDAALAATAIP